MGFSTQIYDAVGVLYVNRGDKWRISSGVFPVATNHAPDRLHDIPVRHKRVVTVPTSKLFTQYRRYWEVPILARRGRDAMLEVPINTEPGKRCCPGPGTCGPSYAAVRPRPGNG